MLSIPHRTKLFYCSIGFFILFPRWVLAEGEGVKLIPPVSGMYHAAFPDLGGWEDEVSATRIRAFEVLAGKKLAWVYFSNNWFDDIVFPLKEVRAIAQGAKRLPFIRLMPRKKELSESKRDYSLARIIEGKYDPQLVAWGRAAKEYGGPLLLEFGTEANGEWFSWNAAHNGAGRRREYGKEHVYDGQERFRDAYRRVVRLMREQGLENVTWFFHVNCPSAPKKPWNTIAGYYPGDDYVDWIGLSCYGAQERGSAGWSLKECLSTCLPELSRVSDKPIALLEFATTESRDPQAKARWIRDAAKTLQTGRFAQIKAVSWWHENFDGKKFRIDSSRESLRAYKEAFGPSFFSGLPRLSSSPAEKNE